MEAEHGIINHRCQRQVIEGLGEELPHVGVAVLAQALVVEAIHLGDLAGLVVAAEDGDAAGVADLESDEEGDGLDRVVSTVDVVAWKFLGRFHASVYDSPRNK